MPRVNPQAAAGEAVSTTPKRVLPTSLPAPELSSDDVREPALSDKDTSLDKPLERGDTQVALTDGHIDKKYLEDLAFMEEPVTIRIEPTAEENAAMTVDCWCQGKGAEWFDERTKSWLEMNFLPIGVVVTTKRKYVEIIARSKTMRVRTPDHSGNQNADNNKLSRAHARSNVFSVIRDSDRGTAWLTRILSESF